MKTFGLVSEVMTCVKLEGNTSALASMEIYGGLDSSLLSRSFSVELEYTAGFRREAKQSKIDDSAEARRS
jgi:hypothetical protein